jgi:hypothetical protein
LETALGISPSRKDHEDSRRFSNAGNETTTAEVVIAQLRGPTKVCVEKAHARVSSQEK